MEEKFAETSSGYGFERLFDPLCLLCNAHRRPIDQEYPDTCSPCKESCGQMRLLKCFHLVKW
jgi:hypothetical protein